MCGAFKVGEKWTTVLPSKIDGDFLYSALHFLVSWTFKIRDVIGVQCNLYQKKTWWLRSCLPVFTTYYGTQMSSKP